MDDIDLKCENRTIVEIIFKTLKAYEAGNVEEFKIVLDKFDEIKGKDNLSGIKLTCECLYDNFNEAKDKCRAVDVVVTTLLSLVAIIDNKFEVENGS